MFRHFYKERNIFTNIVEKQYKKFKYEKNKYISAFLASIR